LKLDLNRVLDREGEVEVVATDVDLCDFRYRGVSPFNSPVKLLAKAQNRAGVVTLNCTYDYTLELTCDRCLTPFTQAVNKVAEHTVLRTLNSVDNDEYLVTEDGFIELSELATNDIILSLPSKFLCDKNCKGLCPICGCDLNHSSCSCVTKEIDPRLAVLDKFFDEDEE